MKTIVFSILFFSLSAQAGVPLGTYHGLDEKGQVCTLSVDKLYFENNQRHPLNERLEVQVLGETWIVKHPPEISLLNERVRFNHDEFKGARATDTGAQGLVLYIDHSQDPHGPNAFSLISDHYQDTSKNTHFYCNQLKLID